MSTLSFKTPYHLRGWLPANLGAVNLTRAHLAMREDYRLDWLIVNWTMQATRALERTGEPGKTRKRRSQDYLSACAGNSRETMNGKIAKFSAPDDRWTDERRRKLSEKNKARARERGLNVRETELMRERDRLAVLLNKDPLYGCSLRYSLRISEELKPQRKERFECLECEEARLRPQGAPNQSQTTEDTKDTEERQKQRQNQKHKQWEGQNQQQRQRLTTEDTEGREGHGERLPYRSQATGHRPQENQKQHQGQKCPHHRRRDAQLFARGFQCEDCQRAKAKFCPHIFDPNAEVNGHQSVMACVYHPKHPDANPCLCALGQLNLEFQQVCPHCGACPKCKNQSPAKEECQACDGRGSRGYMIGVKWNSRESKWEESFLDDGTRSFLSFLQMKGIRKWPIQKKQLELAKDLGVHVNTFYGFRRKAEWLGYLRVAPGEIIRGCTSCGEQYIQTRDHGRRDDGAKCRCGGTGPVDAVKPDKMMWLPDLIMDADIAADEQDRFISLVNDYCKGAGPEGTHRRIEAEKTALRVAEVHRSLLRAWTGEQHTQLAFWNECRRQCQALKDSRIHQTVIDFFFSVHKE